MKDPANWVYDKPCKRRNKKKRRKEIRAHKKARVENGFSWYDWINFNQYLTWVIIQGLTKFTEEAHGYPAYDPETGEELTYDDYQANLKIMIDGFKARDDLNNLRTYKHGEIDWEEWRKPLEARWEKGSALFIKYYGSLWD